MTAIRPCISALIMLAMLAACGNDAAPQGVEIVAMRQLVLSVEGEGELQSAKATPLTVPGSQWADRQLVWMLPEGSAVEKGELLARFSADGGQMQLAQALLDLQRNALARSAKESELQAGQGRVAVDLAKVAIDLGIAQRYASANQDTLARNDVLDAVQDTRFLAAKRDTLQWKRGQFGRRGGAELAVLDAQRATYDNSARTRQADLDALELRAPHAGVLMLTPDWTGQKPVVGTNLNAGNEFGSLPDTAAMEVELALPQIEAQGVEVGSVVELHPVGRPEQTMTSRLSWMASAAKVRSRESPVKYVSMKASVPAAAIRLYALVPGQRMHARVVLLHRDKALSVANVALDNDDGRNYVKVREGGSAGGAPFARRELKLGVRGNARSLVLAGLREGEQVLLTPDTDQKPDTATAPVSTPPAADTLAGQDNDKATGA
jgi:hypothetical protein